MDAITREDTRAVLTRRRVTMNTSARHLRTADTPDAGKTSDPVLAALREARDRRDQADRDIRILLAYARGLTSPRPYRLANLAVAAGMSISGVRVAYTREHVESAQRILRAVNSGSDRSGPEPRHADDLPQPVSPDRFACQRIVDSKTALAGHRERREYAAFVRRVLRAYSRRVASGDIEAITEMAPIVAEMDTAIRDAITGLRARGYNWADIAARLSITRQGAQQRWG
jgi:hypothetical protein